jgi:hypothetical protein
MFGVSPAAGVEDDREQHEECEERGPHEMPDKRRHPTRT